MFWGMFTELTVGFVDKIGSLTALVANYLTFSVGKFTNTSSTSRRGGVAQLVRATES